jgi:hypothetical protein
MGHIIYIYSGFYLCYFCHTFCALYTSCYINDSFFYPFLPSCAVLVIHSVPGVIYYYIKDPNFIDVHVIYIYIYIYIYELQYHFLSKEVIVAGIFLYLKIFILNRLIL